MTTGQQIKQLRLQKGLTQEELAEKTYISARTIQRIENDEVEPRAFTIQAIAAALEIDFEELYNREKEEQEKESKFWIPLLHLSGLFVLFFPPLIIWIKKKDHIKNLREHGVDVLNFQLTMLIYLLLPSIFSFLLITIPIIIIIGMFSNIVIIVNTIKVINQQPYNYPLSLRILKK